VVQQPTDDGAQVLHVHLNELRLSLGQTGTLLQDIQTSIRQSATTLDTPFPPEAVRAKTIQTSSLHVVVQLLDEASVYGQPVAQQVLDIVSRLADGIVVAQVARWMVSRLRAEIRSSSPRTAINAGIQREVLVIPEEDVRIARPRVDTQRDRMVAEVSRATGANPDRVKAAVRAIEATDHARRLIASAGGGYVADADDQRRIDIPSRERNQ
jgi:hypothetical protein